jgi:hypothetical protein
LSSGQPELVMNGKRMQQDDWRPVSEHLVEKLRVVALNTRHCRRDMEMQIEDI